MNFNILLVLCVVILGVNPQAQGEAKDNASTHIRRKVKHYIEHMEAVKADFYQQNHDDHFLTGTLWIDHPANPKHGARMKLVYAPPESWIFWTLDGKTLWRYDQSTRRKSSYPLQGTPMSLLLQRSFSWNKIHWLSCQTTKDMLSVTLAHDAKGRQGTLTLRFTQTPFRLKSWTVLDVQKRKTKVTLLNYATKKTIDPQVFQSLP